MGGAACEITGREGGKTCKIIFGEEQRIKPIDTALVSAVVSDRANKMFVVQRTLCEDSPG